ncbi:MAG: WhiB family transcriptional regulator [Nakamurella sp.]
MSWTVPIRPAVLPSWRALHEALDEVGPVACRGADADLWTSERADERESASHRCAGCPVIGACGNYATVAREKFGTWAGIDRTKPSRKAIREETA